MNRIDRLSAILVQLQSRSLVKAQQIATRFNISLRTVYRDIRALEAAGIPVVGNSGAGYSLVDGFKLPPLLFTQAEAFAFLTAEKLVNELTDAGSSEYYRSGMDKIRAVMRVADKNALESMEAGMDILKHTHPGSDSGNTLQTLMRGIHQKSVLKISYFSDYKQEISERRVEPVGIFFSRANWYLIAFCQTRKAYRTFRVDRIRTVTEGQGTFTKRHPALKKFLEEIRNTQELEEVVIRLQKDKAFLPGNDKYYHGWFSEKETDEGIEFSFLTFSLDKFARWYLSFADAATILKPNTLKDRVKDILKNISL